MNKNKLWLQPDWPAPGNIHAATTLRVGGVSQNQFASFNLATHVGDMPEHVQENRQRLKTLLKLPSEPVWLNQTHSTNVVPAVVSAAPLSADASYTAQSGIVSVVMTADCLPILLTALDGSEVAAIHAGWRGLLHGIIDNTVHAMQSKDFLVWFGPAIGPTCFEVGDDVYQAFTAKAPANAVAFKSLHTGKWLADIYQLARINLTALGISKIYGGSWCTVTDSECFYSYRRENSTGRMATLIWRD